MNLCNPTTVKQIMAESGISFRHEYGQNFLIDPSVPERIAQYCTDDPNSLILEVGPGIGCLTAELAQRYDGVLAVEIDGGLIPVLGKTLAQFDNVHVHHGDIMKVDIPALIAQHNAENRPVSVCANLPYYITTPILMRLMECGVPFSSVTVMVQKEVADRLCAPAGSSDYGAITAVIGYYGTAKKLFGVPSGAFMPAPKVDSAVVRIDIYRERPFHVENSEFFFRVVHGAFEMRRKTLINALSAKIPNLGKADIAKTLVDMGLREDIRGEKLSTLEFAELSNRLYPLA